MTDEVQTEEQELASVMAGYKQARGDEPPAEVAPVEQVEQEQPAVEEPQEVAEEVVEPAPELPSVETLAEELKALKAKVAASANDPDVRRLHGEIGNINRTLKLLQTKPEAPVEDDLTAALKEAEKVAEEYPELAGPLVKALKTSMARGQALPDVGNLVSEEVARIRQIDAIEALREEHPDFDIVRETPEYKTWLANKTPEFQERFLSTWNPAVVSRGLTEFKDSLKVKVQAQERKQHRLATVVTPKGVPASSGPSTIPDEEGLLIGYQSGPKRQILRR